MPKKIVSILLLLVIFLLSRPPAIEADNNDTNKSQIDSSPLSLLSQLASQNMVESLSALNPFSSILNGLDNTTSSSETYQSIKQFWYKDIFSIFFTEVVQAITQFFDNIRHLYLPSIISWLCNAIKQFFLNTDLTKVQNSSSDSNDLSYMLNQFNGTIFSIALDLSLLLFILSIWRYWVDSAWKGNGNLMSPIARLIFAIGLLLAWPTIYSFQIELSNELMNALFLDNNGNIQFLDLAITRLFAPQNLSIENIFSAKNVLVASILGANIDFFTTILLPIIICFLAIILICQLMYVLILKAIQTALMTAQYVFAPIFLVLMTNPVTDNIATGYIRTFVEVSLWNFIWIGLLKILVILLYSNFNPWGKVLTTIGILQIMMDAPQFLAHAKISVASDFVSPRFFVKAAKDITNYDKKLKGGVEILQSLIAGREKEENKSQNTAASNTSNSTLQAENFAFPNNNNPNPNFLPPINKTPTLDNATAQFEQNKQRQPNSKTNNLEGGGSFAAGAGAVFGSTSALNVQTNGSNIAIASSASTASALAIAIASIGNQSSSGTNSRPPKKPKSPSSGPNSPNGPSPEPDTKPPAISGNSNNPKLGPSAGGPNINFFEPKSDLNCLSKLSTNLSKPQSDSNIINGQCLNLSPIGTLSSKYKHSGHPVLRPNTSIHFAQPNSAWQKHELDPKENLFNPSTQSSNTNFAGAPPLIFNQIYAYHTGAINYNRRQKQKRPPYPIMKSILSDRVNNHLSSLNFYDLIFSYGNLPTLMGIPPIYPEANKT